MAQNVKNFRCAAEKSGKSGSKSQKISLRGKLGQKSGKSGSRAGVELCLPNPKQSKAKAKFALVFLTRSKAKQSKAKQTLLFDLFFQKQSKAKLKSKANRNFQKNFQVPNLENFQFEACQRPKLEYISNLIRNHVPLL